MTAPHDPFGYRQELDNALRLPGLDELRDRAVFTDQSASAAYDVAEAFGKCRLTATELGELDGILSVPVALAAGQVLLSRLRDWTTSAECFLERWDELTGRGRSFEADELCLDLLTGLWEGWAASVAISEAWESALIERKPGAEELGKLLAQVIEQRDRLDLATRAQSGTLSTVTHLPYLENCRQMLSSEFCAADGLPFAWWLDGTLERMADEQDRQSEEWRRRFRSSVAPETATAQDSETVPEQIQLRPSRWNLRSVSMSATPARDSGWQTIEFQEAQGRYIAQIDLPPTADLASDERIAVLVCHALEPRKGDPAGEVFHGTRLDLHGLSTDVKGDGRAWFSCLELHHKLRELGDTPLVLLVNDLQFTEVGPWEANREGSTI